MKRLFSAVLAVVVLVVSVTSAAWSAEGMWTLDNPPVKAMQADIGWVPTQGWLDHVMKGSARFGQGCSSSFVSKNGLVLTNHHCVAGCVGQLSTPTSDLIRDGFLAKNEGDERKCPALEINRLEKITDATGDVQKVTNGLSGTAFKSAQNAVRAKLASDCAAGDDRYRCDVVDLYHGGQYKLYRYRRFTDVRLAFAPERSIAFFGGDPDNFNFPRYDLDMALVRVYDAGKPAQIADFFPVNAKGPADGEAVFVTGHPGSTQRELTVAQLRELRDQVLVDNLLRIAEYRGVLLQYRKQDAEAMRIGSNELFGIENGYKVLRGRLETLLDDQFFARKQADEAALRAFVAGHPDAGLDGNAWDAVAAATKVAHDLYQPRLQIEEGRAFNSTYFAMARTLVRGSAERGRPNAERLPEFNDNRMPQVEARLLSEAPIYPDLEKVKLTFSLVKFRELLGADAPLVKQVLGKAAPETMATDLVDHTKLADVAYRKQLWDGGAAAIAASDDPFVRLAVAIDPASRALRARYERDVEAVVQANTEKIAKARFAMVGDSIYPDATSTLRISYGVVKGWTESGTPVAPFTTMGGTYDRATGSTPFALPASWLAKKGAIDPKTPFNFVSTLDSIGGNSGSPLVNKKGELVGLLFDGNIHSLGGAYWYDETINRTVAVDSAAILEALDKVYGATKLSAELRSH